MASFTNQQNAKKEPSVNSNNVMQFYNRNSVMCPGSTLVLNMWNQNIKLEMHPMKAKQEGTNGVFDYNTTMNLVVPANQAYSIAEEASDEVFNAIKNKQPLDVSFQIGATDRLIQFIVAMDSNEVPHVMVKIIRGINNQTLESEGELGYEFNTGVKIYGINSKKVDTKFVFNEVAFFFAAFKAMAIGCLGAENHGRKYIDQHWNTAIYNLYKGLAAKHGINMWNDTGFSNNGGTGFSAFATNNNAKFSASQSAVKAPFPANDVAYNTEDPGAAFQGIKEVASIEDLM